MSVDRIQQSKIDLSHQYALLTRYFEISLSTLNKRLLDRRLTFASLSRDLKQQTTQIYEKTKMNHRIQESRLSDLSMIEYINNKVKHLKSLSSALYSSNPYQPLERGYALIKDTHDKPLTSVNQLNVGDDFIAMLKDGYIESKVVKTIK